MIAPNLGYSFLHTNQGYRSNIHVQRILWVLEDTLEVVRSPTDSHDVARDVPLGAVDTINRQIGGLRVALLGYGEYEPCVRAHCGS
ncbi:hypothetical protein D3C81_2196940 [compost metagenome]